MKLKNTAESEKYYLLASKQTKLGWLYLTQIAFNEYKDSKENKLFFLDLTVKFYKKYLQSKNKQFPISKVYLCGDIDKEKKEEIIKEMEDYFDFTVTSYPKGEFENSRKFKEEIEKNDFILMIVKKDIDYELTYELGLTWGLGKPTIVLISQEIQKENPFIEKIATIVTNISSALIVLKMLSLIKNGESLKIEEKSEKLTIDELLKELKENQFFVPEFESRKPNLSLLRG